MIKFLKYFFEAIIVYIFFLIGKLLGLKNSKKIFSVIFQKVGPLFKSNEIVSKNLNKFLPNIPSKKKNKIIRAMWSNYGKTFIEYVFLRTYQKEKDYVKFEGLNFMSEVLIKKKPVIFISGHFANFEIMSMEIVKKGFNLATIYRPLNNFFLNPFMEFLRKKYVCKNQIKKGRSGVRDAMQFINNGCSIALMIDQRVSEGELINFFEHKAHTTTLPAQLALKYNLSIVPVFIKRQEDNKFTIKFHTPIDSSKFKDKSELTESLNKKLEGMIIQNPEQWIWTHDRWKL
jgi:Kdo2-lipid IVA lauroyltransferase/acyltransferase